MSVYGYNPYQANQYGAQNGSQSYAQANNGVAYAYANSGSSAPSCQTGSYACPQPQTQAPIVFNFQFTLPQSECMPSSYAQPQQQCTAPSNSYAYAQSYSCPPPPAPQCNMSYPTTAYAYASNGSSGYGSSNVVASNSYPSTYAYANTNGGSYAQCLPYATAGSYPVSSGYDNNNAYSDNSQLGSFLNPSYGMSGPYGASGYNAGNTGYGSMPALRTNNTQGNYGANNAYGGAGISRSEGKMIMMLLQLLVSAFENKSQGTGTNTPPPPPPPPTILPGGQKAGSSNVWGDPHFVTADGTTADDQIAAGNNTVLLENSDGARIIAQTSAFGAAPTTGPQKTVFTTETVNLGDGTRVQLNGDGTANTVDANGKVLSQLTDGQTITSTKNAKNTVTYNKTAETLTYNFTGTDASTVTGTVQAVANPTANYINTTITAATGNTFGGMLAALVPSFTGITTDPTTGAGLFNKAADGTVQTNANFKVASLYS